MMNRLQLDLIRAGRDLGARVIVPFKLVCRQVGYSWLTPCFQTSAIQTAWSFLTHPRTFLISLNN